MYKTHQISWCFLGSNCFKNIIIVQDYQVWWISIPAIIMIAREIFISALREFMSSRGRGGDIAVSEMGKYKTFAQMLSLQGLIWHPDYDIPLILFDIPYELLMGLAYILFFVATILTIWSMLSYFKVAWPVLKVEK